MIIRFIQLNLLITPQLQQSLYRNIMQILAVTLFEFTPATKGVDK